MAENQNINKSLSIRLSTNGLSFCVYAPGTEQPFTYKEYDVTPTVSMAANVKMALQNEPMLQEQYQRVNVLITQPHFTLVPVAFFKPEDIDTIYQFNFPKDKPQHTTYNVLRRMGVAIIFSLDRSVYQLLLDDFPRARFYASSATLIEFLGERSMLGTNKKMFCYLHEREMTLYAFDRGQLLYANTFSTPGVMDMQYYTLNVWNELSFDQIDDSLMIIGDNDIRHDLSKKITNFIKNVELMDRKNDFRNSITGGNSTIPYDLQTMLVCGY